MTTPNDAGNRSVLHAVLPAMHLRIPIRCGEVVFCTTDHLDQYTIEPASILAAVRQLATQYCDDHGNPLKRLGLVLLPRTSAAQLVKHGVSRWCRDAVALCFITRGACLNSHHQQATSVSNSDYFDALPIRLREKGGFTLQRPGRLGTSNSLAHYHPALPTYLGTPRDGDFQLDTVLLDAIDRAATMYLSGRQRRSLCQIFRAIAIAMHATRILPETESTYYDLGIRIIGWVSAFETLVHPGTGRIGLNNVLGLIKDVDWTDAPPRTQGTRRRSAKRLRHKRYVARDTKGHATGRENAACHLYRRLYNLRNAVAHGNQLKPRGFAANPKRRGRIDQAAPLLFRGCLLERLRQLDVVERTPRQGPLTPNQFRAAARTSLDASHFDEALAEAILG